MKHLPFFQQIGRALTLTFVVAFALLCFPSVLPYMVAGWLVWHSALVALGRAGWVPLATCFVILIAKRVPLTPAVIALCAALLLTAAIRIRFPSRVYWFERFRWLTVVILWVAWVGFCWEWQSIIQCNRFVAFDGQRPIVCIGDSLTSGLIPEPGYPGALKAMLSVPVINLGQSGIATDVGRERMPKILEHHPQVVVIELGGHDFLQGHSRAHTKANLISMIQACREHGAEVVLIEIPRGFIYDPFSGLEREIAYQFDVQLVADTAIRQLVIWSPVSPPGMWLPDSRLSDDGIHSNERGSIAMAKYVAGALESMLGPDVLAKK